MKHSSLPWSIGGDGADIFGYGVEPDGSDCDHVADVQPDDSGLLGMSTKDVANAQFIVKACNNHYKLLKALKDLVNEPANYTEKAAWEAIKEAE